MVHVLVTAPFPSPLLDKLRAVSSEVELEQMTVPGYSWPAELTIDAEILYAIGAVPQPAQAPNLRWIQLHSAGMNHLLEEQIWETGIHITTASGIHAPNLGQYVMAQILAWSHHVPKWLAYQGQHEWPKDRWDKFLPRELRGQTIGILGYGSIGREVARLAKSFGMTVLVTKRDAKSIVDEGYSIPGIGDPNGEMADRIYPPEATRSMVAECDYLVLTLPLTPKSHHLIDESMFRAMKPNCYLVNVGRGPLVNEADLDEALKKGRIAGAGLDVFENEPLPEDSPLWARDNVIISPHVSGFTSEYDDRVVALFAENLRRYLVDEPLLNLVNRDTGY